MPFPVTYLLDQLSPSETFIQREVDQLRQRGWPVFTHFLKGGPPQLAFSLASCPQAARRRFCRAAGARLVQELPRSPATAARLLKRLPQAASLAAAAAGNGSRLIHAQFAGITADLAAVAAHALGIPWACSVHARDVFTCPPALLARRLHPAAAVTACSRRAVDAVVAAGIPPAQVALIRHGLMLRDYPFDTDRPRDLLFTACRLEPKKGVDTLLRACGLLLQRGVPFSCAVAGDGSCRQDLESLSASLGLGQAVKFLGWQPQAEVRSQLQKAAVLALPSRRTRDGDSDGIANILVEALALGTPVVTTEAGAAGEAVTDGVNGLLVPSDDPGRLAEALASLLAEKERRVRLAEAGRKTAEALFDGSKNIGELEAFFKRAAAPTET